MAFFAGPVCAELSPDEIIQKVDEVRNPEFDFTTDVRVTSYQPNRPDHFNRYEVYIKGKGKTIVKTVEPEIERGRSLLMRDNDFWAFFPEVAKPIRVSLQQRLTGEVANGDIARTNFSGDYSAEILRKDIISGKDFFVLQLSAIKDTATYGKVVLWVMAENFWPVKAEFYAVSGRFLKTCSYENYKTLAGTLRPSKLVIRDAIVKEQYSVIEYDQMTVGEIPEKNFSKEYLNKMAY